MTSPSTEQIASGLTDTILVSGWSRHHERGEVYGGDVSTLDAALPTPAGPTWAACGNALLFTVVHGADHPIASIERHAGQRLLDWVADFADAAASAQVSR